MLAGLSLGCGRVVEIASGERLPGSLVLPAGLTVVILAGEFATLTGATALLAGPLAVALAAAGLIVRPPWPVRCWRAPVAAAVGTFAAFAAPTVLSGHATFDGYIKLDDTATYFAMTDRVMEHARSLTGLAPSTYEATLATTVKLGYPTGSLMPVGIGHSLLSYDIAWLFQPYLAFLAAMLALALYAILERLIYRPALRAGAAFVAAQPAILYGYSLWGGVKELAGAWLLALIAALAPRALLAGRTPRAGIPLAAAVATLVCVLSLPGGAWLIPLVIAGAVFLFLHPTRALLVRAVVFAGAAVLLAIPAIAAAFEWLPHVGSFGKETELGNLIHRLSPLQAFGIWPVDHAPYVGDFRVHPHNAAPVYVLIVLVIAAGAAGLWWAWTQRSWELLAYVGTAAIGCAGFVAASSPWVGGKTLAMAAPAFVAAALAACGAGLARQHFVPAAIVAIAITGGVLWSNVLQYHGVWLAPRGQLHELETIGHRYAGDSPALMTNYEPYGARHFLRRLDAEGASELRRRFDYLTNGATLDKGQSADIDRFRLDGVLTYRTLVLRRGPAESRPPSVYRLVWSGRYYEVWQRPESPARGILVHMPLGNAAQAAAVPRCSEVLQLAKTAGAVALATATRPEAIPLGYPPVSGVRTALVTLSKPGVYTAWLGGDWFGNASISVDGKPVGSMREELDWPGNYIDLGRISLSAGRHLVAIGYRTGGWHPGSGGTPYAFGPAYLTRENAREPVRTVPASDARSLCGERLDWVEALSAT
ncbi:MAG: hypothetical protein ACXVFC_09040 [Gaiellaceae bacterium]